MSIKPISISQNGSSVLPVKTVQENVNMDNANVFQSIFDSRRQFVPSNSWGKRLDLTLEQIETLSPYPTLVRLFGEGRIRVTNNANGSRRDATPVIFPNGPQSAQTGSAFALLDYVPYLAQAIKDTAGDRQIALLDKAGDRDLLVYETRNPATGWIDYRVFFAAKQFNQHGQVVGLNETGENSIQEWIKASVDGGYVGFDGVQRDSHNQWVDKYNAALEVVAAGTATDADREMVKKADTQYLAADPNKFVSYNSRRHVLAESVANKYALLSWLTLDLDKPAFEVYNRAKTVESNQKFIEGMAQMMTRSYRNQLKTLAGLYATE